MPVTSIRHVQSCCGGGKSTKTISELVAHQSTDITDRVYLFASKTKQLSKQNFDNYAAELSKSGYLGPYRLVDSSTEKNVVNALENSLRTSSSGVLFVSHTVVSMIDPKLLNGVTVIFDEVPQELIRTLMVRFEDKDSNQHWEKYLITQDSTYKGYRRVSISPTVDSEELKRIVSNVNLKRDNSITQEVARLLTFILEGYEVLYYTTTDADSKPSQQNKKFCVYQALEWRGLRDIIDHADSIIVLSAQLKRTQFGFLTQNFLNVSIYTRDISPSIKLEKKHRQRARIYPILREGRWSSTLKRSLASEKLQDPNNTIDFNDTVATHAQRIIDKRFGSMNYLLIPNEQDPLIEPLQSDNVTKITSAAHGVNDYRKILHSAFIASNRPNPFEEKTHTMFALDHGLDPNELNKTLITERCHEAAYQSIARTAIRDFSQIRAEEHLIFVPDMEYAEYLLEWFHDGCATIDTSLSCTLRSQEQKKSDNIEKWNKLVRILSGKGKRGVKMADLLAKEGISRRTFERYKAQFNVQLRQLGFI